MAVRIEKNSLHYLSQFPPIRCDTHFRYNIKIADSFFSNPRIKWASLGSALENVRNGLNIKTDFYSMDETDILYLSVSQIKEYGLVEKNQNYLTDEVKDLNSYFDVDENMLLITRSGTIGVALSTNHPSFLFDEFTYVASGFVITADVKDGFSSDVIAGYINLFDVQKYLTAMAAGACQKNIAQPTINNLPIPECLLSGATKVDQYFADYTRESRQIINSIQSYEKKLHELKSDISSAIKNQITEYYRD